MSQAWQLVPVGRKLALGVATLLMVVTSGGNTYVAVLLGQLVNSIQNGLDGDSSKDVLYSAAFRVLATMSVIYLLREAIKVERRYFVESSCTSINRDMQRRLVEHLLKTDLAAISQDKPGTLHGKIFRSVDGLVRFTRLIFLDCLPAILTGVFALVEANSALDNISERHVQHALGITNKERTAIIIAHRLSTLKECDRILVFDNGHIVEEGTSDDLVQRNGFFAEMVAYGDVGMATATARRTS